MPLDSKYPLWSLPFQNDSGGSDKSEKLMMSADALVAKAAASAAAQASVFIVSVLSMVVFLRLKISAFPLNWKRRVNIAKNNFRRVEKRKYRPGSAHCANSQRFQFAGSRTRIPLSTHVFWLKLRICTNPRFPTFPQIALQWLFGKLTVITAARPRPNPTDFRL